MLIHRIILFLLIPNLASLNYTEDDYDNKNVYSTENSHEKFIFVPLSPNATRPEPTNNFAQNVLVNSSEKGESSKGIGTLRIINGTPAKLGDVPWQIALKKRSGRGFLYSYYKTFCGGAIIARNKALTAAHCVEQWMSKSPFCNRGVISGSKLRRIFVVAGTLRTASRTFNEDGQWRNIKKATYPPRYRFPQNDISVLILTNNFTYNDHVHSVLMQTTYEDMSRQCLASGFGCITSVFDRNKIQSDVLLTAYLRLMTNNECYTIQRKNTNKFICTAAYPSDTSSGDSGGPLVCLDPNKPKTEGRLVGIVSGGKLIRVRGEKLEASFFTRVSAYQKFIARSEADSLQWKSSILIIIICLYIFSINIL